MATRVNVPNIIDEAKANYGTGGASMLKTAELLAQSNPVLRTCFFGPSSHPRKHVFQVRSSIGGTTRRRYDEGVEPQKGQTDQHEIKLGNIFRVFEIDYKQAVSSGSVARYFNDELEAAHQAVSQQMSRDIFYGNDKTDKEAWRGLATMLNSKTAKNGGQIVDGGGTGNDNRSIWAVCWGPRKASVLYDRHMPVGVNVVNLAPNGQDVFTKTNARVKGKTTNQGYQQVIARELSFHGGVAVEDWRYVARYANIDISELKDDATGSSTNLVNGIRRLIQRIEPYGGRGRLAMYAPRGVIEVLKAQEVNYIKQGLLGLPNMYNTGLDGVIIDGVPLYREDALDTDEDRVT